MDKVLDKIWDGDIGSDFVDWFVLIVGFVMLGIVLIVVIDISVVIFVNDQMNVLVIIQVEV